MSRPIVTSCSILLLLLAACGVAQPALPPAASPPEAAQARSAAAGAVAPFGTVSSLTREWVGGDVYHYELVIAVGTTPNAQLHLHRVVAEREPWRPAPTSKGVFLMHGDFATFVTNFAPTLGTPPSPAPGLAPELAAHGLDVWGLDRRWNNPTSLTADLSDFAGMGFAQELDDVRIALGAARALRAATGSGDDRLALLGFSRGGELAYAYASQEALRPAGQRQVDALVSLDGWLELDPRDAAARQFFCDGSAQEYALVAQGVVDADNRLFIALGSLAASAPSDPSPYFPPLTNRGALLTLAGQTALFFPATPAYHLAGPVLDTTGTVAGLRFSPEAAVDAWFAGARPHQSMREVADGDALWCGSAPPPVDASLARIQVPLLYLGAAGGFGDHGLWSASRVGSTDVTTLVIRRLAAGREAEDFGHGDLLYGTDAPELAWGPLRAWLEEH